MMIRIITSILILLLCSISIAQTNYVALITDPQIGPDANAEKLIEVVDDINKRDSISYVVVMGNITANGKFDEFLWAQEILDGLTAPYNVIGGKKDYTLSEGKGNEISLLWGDDKYSYDADNVQYISFNNIITKRKISSLIDLNTAIWLNEKFEGSTDSCLIIFSHYNSLEHLSDVTYQNVWYNGKYNFSRNVFFVSAKSEREQLQTNLISGVQLHDKDFWNYNLLKVIGDSLYLYSVQKDTDPIFSKEFRRSTSKSKYNPAHWSEKYIDHSWPRKYLDHSVYAESVISNGRIFTATKNGEITCLDIRGTKKWLYETNGTIYSSPKVEKDLLIVATNEGDLFTINKNTGNLFQVIGIGETITSDIELVDMEFNGMQTKGICFGTAEGNFYCYELYLLELIWWNNGVKEMINSSVATVKGKVIFQDKKGILYCLNSQSGVLLWKWKASTKSFDPLFKSDLIVSSNNVYFIDFDGDLHCIDVLLGTIKWSIRKIDATGKIELNEKGNEIVIHSAENKILIISLAKEKVIKEIILPVIQDEIATDILSIGNTIFAGFTDGSVYDVKEIFRIIFQGYAPIVSLNKINGNILVTDYDGNLTLLNLIP